MPVTAPTLIIPSGPRSPWNPFAFQFAQTSSTPDHYDIQATTDPTFADIDLWHYANQTAGLTPPTAGQPATVKTTYLGPTPVIGVTYYWRARGRRAPSEIGPWSRSSKFLPDPMAVDAPYANWARDVLEQWSEPRASLSVGTLIPVGPEVLALLTTEYQGLWRARDDIHLPPTDELVQLYGLTLHVDKLGGWEVTGLTLNLEPGEIDVTPSP